MQNKIIKKSNMYVILFIEIFFVIVEANMIRNKLWNAF